MSDLTGARERWFELAERATKAREEERAALLTLLRDAFDADSSSLDIEVCASEDGGWTIQLRSGAKPMLDKTGEMPADRPAVDASLVEDEAALPELPKSHPHDSAATIEAETDAEANSQDIEDADEVRAADEDVVAAPTPAPLPPPSPAPLPPESASDHEDDAPVAEPLTAADDLLAPLPPLTPEGAPEAAEKEVRKEPATSADDLLAPLPPLPLVDAEDTVELPGGPLPDLPLPPVSEKNQTEGRSEKGGKAASPAPAPLAGLPPLPADPVAPPVAASEDQPDAASPAAAGAAPAEVRDPAPAGDSVPVAGAPTPALDQESSEPRAPAGLAELFENLDDTRRVPPTERRDNRFLNASVNPQSRAERLARTLVGDIVVYKAEEHSKALAAGPEALRSEFGDDIDAARAEFLRQIDPEKIDAGTVFTAALNEVIAHGQKVF